MILYGKQEPRVIAKRLDEWDAIAGDTFTSESGALVIFISSDGNHKLQGTAIGGGANDTRPLSDWTQAYVRADFRLTVQR